ncbi:MAG: vitamin B12-dependent ribonucleotide reductase [Firmicutes bacterium]|nr:vitamin B12-dependent ribonucleotide reductase [Bacillota bacterium]
MQGKLSPNAMTVLKRRYLRRNEQGELIEDPEGMFRRVARNISLMDLLYYPAVYDVEGGQTPQDDAEEGELPGYTEWDLATLRRAYGRLNKRGHMKVSFAELCRFGEQNVGDLKAKEDELFTIQWDQDFCFNSPTLMNAGLDLQQLSACFVLPVDDSMESIFDSVKHAALIHKSGGGTGFSFSRLRPKNDIVKTTGGVASGPVSFLRVFDASTQQIKQGGRRRGANLGLLNCNHPDILEFITCKADDDSITNFNLSVGITDEFMAALEEGREYDLINPRTGAPIGSLRAQEVFDLLVEMAWTNGEPGVIFLDRVNAKSTCPHLGPIETTNPCGEQPLLPYESCNLGSINLARFVSQDGDIDWERLRAVVHQAVHYLDNVVDANCYPLPQIEEMTLKTRKIGLGVMGWAELLIKLGIPYDSEEAVALGEEVMGFIQRESKAASAKLAEVRGVFPAYSGSSFEQEGLIQRNATTTTIAPTGTISIICNTSGGIEPLFSVGLTRTNVLDGDKMVEINELFKEEAAKRELWSSELAEKVAEQGKVGGLSEIPADMRRVFVTALEIAPEWHVRMQAAFQKYTDNAVSKTVNLPQAATREEVASILRLAYRLGCKGITIYRDGSRQEQVLHAGKVEEKRTNGEWGVIRPLPRPDKLHGISVRKETPMGSLFLTLNMLDDHPFELFAQIGRAGSDVSAFTEAIARLISLAFRCGVDPMEVANQLKGIGGSRTVGFGLGRVRSVPDAIGQFIADYLQEKKGSIAEEDSATLDGDVEPQRLSLNLCPSCGMQALVHVEGCAKCVACGHSEC